MWIYIKTSPYNENSYTQHLIEHLVCRKDSSPQAFFLKDFPLRASSWLGYSSFYFNSLEVSDVKNQLFSPFEIQRIPLEKKLIREECSAPQSDKTLLVNRLWKDLYWKHFWWAKSSDKVTIWELFKQHALYYNQAHCWVADNDFWIIERPQHITTEATLWCIPSSQSYVYTIRKIPYTAKVFDGLENGSYAFCYFLDWFCYVRSQYYHNYCWRAYDFPTLEFFEYQDKLALIFCNQDKVFFNIPLSEAFFQEAMDYFLGVKEYLQEIALVTEIRIGKIVSQTELKKFIAKITWEEVQNHFHL